MVRIVALFVIIGVALATAAPALAQDATIPRGMKVYADRKCSLCHSIAGKGNAKGPLDGVGAKLAADEIKQWIVDPKAMTLKTKAERKPPMKAYPGLAAEDLDALIAYLQSLKGK